MGAVCKLIDAVFFLIFAIMAVTAPLIFGVTILPGVFFPAFMVDLYQWYSTEFGDYLLVEKPHFLVGVFWHELLILWPLSIANMYAILAGKSWFGTTSMVYGASLVTSMAATLGELIGSGRASERLLMMHVPLMVFGILALLRGLLSQSNKTGGAVGKRPAILSRTKHA